MNNKEKKFRFSNGFIGTVRQAIEGGLFVDSDIKQVPSVQFNRVKYNRMNQAEQDIYQGKLDTLKAEYRLYNKDNTFITCCLRDYLYFNTWLENKDIKDNPNSYCSDKELAGLFS